MSDWLLTMMEHAWQCALSGLVLLGAAWCMRAHRAQQILLAGGLLKFMLPVTLAAPFSLFALVAPLAPAATVARDSAATITALVFALLAIWALGAVLMLTRMANGLRALRAETEAARPLQDAVWLEELRVAAARLDLWLIPELRVSDAPGAGPRACGLFRPLILIPAALVDALPRASIRAILMHEMAHHRRGDVALALFANLTVALWWWHPVTWLLAAALRRAAEHACDDVVVTQPDISRDEYCTALLSAARACAGGLQPAAGFAEHPLHARLRRVIAGRIATGGRRTAFAAAAVVLILLPGSRTVTAQPRALDDDIVIRIVDRNVLRDVSRTVDRRTSIIPGNGRRPTR